MPSTLKFPSAPALHRPAGSYGSLVLRMALVLMFFLGAVDIVAAAESIRPFTSGSLKQVLASRANKPFILVLWSLDCQYCPTELKMLSELEKSHPGLDVVLIATDTVDDMPQLADRAGNYGTAKFEQWVFAEDMPERLRQEIDGRWYGEVPRTYFYDQKHQRTVKMGLINKSLVEEWLARNAVDTANGKQNGKY
ncbi:Thiol-disulfide isomerase or thioredoxin [Nitrosospira multiformis ATCC 25196]|uniref:Possible signal peptide protein n=2 Tax=Nitrosospira multiformis TaxID=1231 RepID=Q2YA68_NITMU|nr:redoxin domain-containing protein [Nitrosospira multiformis]ABB74353.1 possible signal peptide protein [Nitrosospira multiformis ATCC 25196]SEA09574.1 Thiol-disulfide isomerase or thioredoxin [Nitrosospira multiformis]SEF50820.1 Thiol-disulfide isomerase or thioredoxin [Nitrosospira multiformis ATCC 25196]